MSKDAEQKVYRKYCFHPNQGGGVMSATDPNAVERTQNPQRVPMMQRVLDNPFLLLFLGVTLPTVLYLIWGIMEVASIPLAK
jgi:hypothetical protein